MIENEKNPHLCFIGNMLGRNAGYVTTQGQIVADLFAGEDYRVTCVSSQLNRARRLAEIVETLLTGFRNFDVVLLDTYSGLSFITADVTTFLCNKLGLPIVMILRGGNLPEFSRKYPRWTKRVLRRADALVAPSAFLADEIGNREKDFEIPVIPNIIDIDRYPFRERSRIEPKLIWMRSFHPVYNPQMAVEVLARLRETHPQATLTMAGNDKGIENDVKKLVAERCLGDAVRFAGFLDFEKKIGEFSAADIYLCTNRIDNMPVSVVEARALGLPVVATDVGGLPYLIEHGKNGLLGPTGDVETMVGNIRSLLNNVRLTRQISANGRRAAEYSAWKAVRKDWEKLIFGLLEAKQNPDGLREAKTEC
jgi:L-malate glycosyltransferase